jgi:hypothetical protein
MARARKFVAKRVRVFLACEGESERAYGRWLQEMGDAQGIRIHIDAHVCGGGDPLALIQQADRHLARAVRRGGPFAMRLLLYDADRIGDDRERDAEALALAGRLDMMLIEQHPDHEGLLLRHLPDCQKLRPPTGATLQALLRVWPEYSKGTDFMRLATKLDFDGLNRAADVEAKLAKALRMMGFKF